MQVDQHIRACPAIREANGLEPYPQPSVVFSAAVSGTAQVRIYDVSVQPMVELTSGALSGAELTSPTLAGLSNNYVLDMGHANVTAVVDCMTREGLECVVMFEDSGGTGEKRYVRVTCNDADHVVALYPDNAIYALNTSGNTGTAFPNGSIYKPCSLLADACSLLTSRSAGILDISGGTWNGGTDVPNNTKCGAHLKKKVIRSRPGFIAYWTPNVDMIDCEDATFLGYDGNMAIAMYGSAAHGAPHKVIGCKVGPYNASGISGRWGDPTFIGCTIDGDFATVVIGGANNVWSTGWQSCIFDGNPTLAFNGVGSGTASSLIACTGAFELNTLSVKTVNVEGVIGSPDVALQSGVILSTVNISGAYNSITDNGSSNTVNEKQLAHRSNLTANIITLASGAITATEAPNLDAAVSSRSAFNAASDSVTVGTNNDKAGYSMAGTLQSLDALDTAQDTQHASTQADIATVDGLVDTLIARLTAARAANLDSLDVASSTLATSAALATVDGLVDTLIARLTAARATNLDNLDAAISTLATSAALAVVDSNVDALLVRLGANDTAIIKGLLLGNYRLDGGSGNASAVYDANGCMTGGRIRVFASSSATSSATGGAADGADSEIARVDLTASAVAGEAYPATVQGLLT